MGIYNFENFKDHPRVKGYVVFHFSESRVGDYFEELLKEQGLYYERGFENDFIKRHLFGVKKSDFNKALELNNEALAKFRRPFLGTTFLKYFVVLVTFLMLLLAIIGYLLH